MTANEYSVFDRNGIFWTRCHFLWTCQNLVVIGLIWGSATFPPRVLQPGQFSIALWAEMALWFKTGLVGPVQGPEHLDRPLQWRGIATRATRTDRRPADLGNKFCYQPKRYKEFPKCSIRRRILIWLKISVLLTVRHFLKVSMVIHILQIVVCLQIVFVCFLKRS